MSRRLNRSDGGFYAYVDSYRNFNYIRVHSFA
jgi:hypothetical protein